MGGHSDLYVHKRGVQIKLVKDLQELKDDDQIKIEVQALTVPSVAKAVEALEEWARKPADHSGTSSPELARQIEERVRSQVELKRQALMQRGFNKRRRR